jgi:hypothetical protein
VALLHHSLNHFHSLVVLILIRDCKYFYLMKEYPFFTKQCFIVHSGGGRGNQKKNNNYGKSNYGKSQK